MSMKTSFVTPVCCAHPSVAIMDHITGWHEHQRSMVNRVCVRCWTHWYGHDGVNVVEFPRNVWDRWMSQPEQVAA